MADFTVKYFNSGMTGAPQISNNWGDLVTMLDACLVNGFALKAIDTLTCVDGLATATISAGHAMRWGRQRRAPAGGVVRGAGAWQGCVKRDQSALPPCAGAARGWGSAG